MAKSNRICSVAACDKKVHGRSVCRAHYCRQWREGKFLRAREVKAHDWVRAHVGFDGPDCLIWPFARSANGYGNMYFEGGYTTASRVMCYEAHGSPPSDVFDAAHSCGNGHQGCVHPLHLRWATKTANNLEKTDHGTLRKGGDCNFAVLTIADVRRIRAALPSKGNRSFAEFASDLGLGKNAVWKVATGRSWVGVE